MLNPDRRAPVRTYRSLRDAADSAEQIWLAHKTLLESFRDLAEREARVADLRGQGGPANATDLEAKIAQYEVSERAKYMNWEQARLEFEDALERRTAAMEERAPEEVSFWIRRFHTSLAIAHGGAFLAIVNKIFAPDTSAALAQQLVWPMAAFSLGLLLAGVIPVANYSERAGAAKVLAWSSASAFVAGLALGLRSALDVAGLALPWAT